MKKFGVCACFFLFLVGCNNREKYTPPYYEPDASSLQCDSIEENILFDDVISVPFIEVGGVKYIDVELNRTFSVRMILDSGCSGTLISIAEAQHLYSKGVLTDDDFIGVSRSMIADGSIMENMVVNLREIIIGGKIVCSDVQAMVSADAQAPLLLGNEVLNRLPSYTVNNQNKTIDFKIK